MLNFKLKYFVFIIIFFVFSTLHAKNVISYNQDGWNYLSVGDTQNAIFNFKSALKKNPSYYESLIGLGEAYYRLEQFDIAYTLYKRAVSIDSDSSRGLMGLAFTLTSLGRYTEALNYFSKAEGESGENLDASYGIAYLYNAMGKQVIAKRKLTSVLRINPYHYNSLLLLAEIENEQNRIDKAKKLILKAINSNNEALNGYLKLGEIFISDYLKTYDKKSIKEANFYIKSALSIHPKSLNANRLMGNIFYIQNNYSEAIDYFAKSLEQHENSSLLYNLAVAYDKNNDKKNALKYFLRSYKKKPLDSITKSRIEDFLILNNYKIGHPIRVMFNNEEYKLALSSEKLNMSDEAIAYFRRSLYLNRQNQKARKHLNTYYSAFDYNRFYIDGIKKMMKVRSSRKLRTKLNLEIIKRRNYLYHKEGFSSENPKRDVPNILVLNFLKQRITKHIDAGNVIANNITFHLKQFGRQKVINVKKRESIVGKNYNINGYRENILKFIKNKIKSNELQSIDYIVFGNFSENQQRISLNCNILDNKTGIVIDNFSLFESGKEALTRLTLRSARKIFNVIPYKGRVLKLKDNGFIVNLGLFDGVKVGGSFYINKFGSSLSNSGQSFKRKIFLKVKKVNTLIMYVEPENVKYLKEIDYNDFVYPLKQRGAKLVK